MSRAKHSGPARELPGGPRRREPGFRMSVSNPPRDNAVSGPWIGRQPYLLLCITALCWAGNAIVGRLAAGHIPPGTLSLLRWPFAFLIILPVACPHLTP